MVAIGRLPEATVGVSVPELPPSSEHAVSGIQSAATRVPHKNNHLRIERAFRIFLPPPLQRPTGSHGSGYSDEYKQDACERQLSYLVDDFAVAARVRQLADG
jgi:hypothetical protein